MSFPYLCRVAFWLSWVVTRDLTSRPFRDEKFFVILRRNLGKREFDILYFLRGPIVAKMGGNAEVYVFRPRDGMKDVDSLFSNL